jgi:hypothetical protein
MLRKSLITGSASVYKTYYLARAGETPAKLGTLIMGVLLYCYYSPIVEINIKNLI